MDLKFLKESVLRVSLSLDDDVWFAEREFIEMIAKAAEDDALEFIARPLDEVIDVYGQVPTNIILACTHRVVDSYTNRNPNQQISRKDILAPVPAAQWQDILKPYIKPEAL